MHRLIYIVASGVVSCGICTAFAGNLPVVQAPAVKLAAASKPAMDETHEIHRVTAEAADHAMSKKGVESLLEIVARADRDRIEKEMTKGDDAAYEAIVKKVQKIWKEKYKNDFNAFAHLKDLSDLKVTLTGQGHDQQASVALPAESGAPAYELHLTREKSGWWRIQLPDTVDGKTFYANAMKAIENVDAGSVKWPDSEDAAYPVVITQLLQEMSFPATAK